MIGVYGPVGDLRLLRHADRLEWRDRARARAAVRRRADATALARGSRARAGLPARASGGELPSGPHRCPHAAPGAGGAGSPCARGGLDCWLSPLLGAVDAPAGLTS